MMSLLPFIIDLVSPLVLGYMSFVYIVLPILAALLGFKLHEAVSRKK
jgi:hypothetical protein